MCVNVKSAITSHIFLFLNRFLEKSHCAENLMFYFEHQFFRNTTSLEEVLIFECRNVYGMHLCIMRVFVYLCKCGGLQLVCSLLLM